MILEYYLGDSHPEPDDAGSFKELRARNVKGLALAYLSLSQRNWEGCKLLQVFGRPCWSWHSKFHKTIKSPRAALGFATQMSQSWMSSPHLLEMAGLCGRGGKEKLADAMYWAVDCQELAAKAWAYNIDLLGQRCGSLSKFGTSPHVYAGLLEEDGALMQNTLKTMKHDFKLLQQLEISSVPHAGSIAADLRLCLSNPVRIVMNCLDALGWRLTAVGCDAWESAMCILRCILLKYPDTKSVEDLHQRVRGKQNSRSNNKMTLGCLQHIVNFSNIIDARGGQVRHPAAVSQEVFLQHYRQTKATLFNERKMMLAKTHKLPKMFSTMLDPKAKLHSITEASLVRSAAAWSWVRAYHCQRLGHSDVELQVVCNVQNSIFICHLLGNLASFLSKVDTSLTCWAAEFAMPRRHGCPED